MIEVKNIDFRYSHRGKLFNNLSLTLESGYIHGVLGCNGTGKSTLLKMFCGLIAPQHGSINILGNNPMERTPEFYRQVFIVPEEFDMPAISFAKYAKLTSAFYPNFSPEAMEHYVNEFEIEPKVRLDKISMGQKKRAQIAFALACNVPLLIMDEPTNGLDIPSKSTFRRLLASYAEPNNTVVISTHQVRDVENLIDNVVIMDSKGIILNQTTEQITKSLYFGMVSPDDQPMYTEQSIGGLMGVARNRTDMQSKINLELLFNTAVNNRAQMQTIFNR